MPCDTTLSSESYAVACAQWEHRSNASRLFGLVGARNFTQALCPLGTYPDNVAKRAPEIRSRRTSRVKRRRWRVFVGNRRLPERKHASLHDDSISCEKRGAYPHPTCPPLENAACNTRTTKFRPEGSRHSSNGLAGNAGSRTRAWNCSPKTMARTSNRSSAEAQCSSVFVQRRPFWLI